MLTPDPGRPTPLRSPGAPPTAPKAGRLPGWLVLASWIVLPTVAVILLAMLSTGLIAGLPGAAAGGVVVAPTDTAAAPSSTPVAPAVATAPPDAAPDLLPTLVPVDATALALLQQLPATVALPTDTPTPEIPTDTPTPVPSDTPVPTDTPEPRDPLTGLPTDPATLLRVPLTIMIDNHPDAAPQTGLNDAGLVFEALAEGGITRFMAIFTSENPGTVGPVRSARPYYLEWARPFQSLYVHCGGSWEAIDLLEEWDMLTDVDCFNGNMPFWRSNDRLLPHNLYTSTSELWKLAARKGITAPAAMPGLLHGPEAPWEARPAGGSVGFTFSSLSRSDVEWVYDRDTNSYRRKQWGYWHRDYETGAVVTAKNVAIIFSHVWELPGDEKGRMGTDTTGRNTALIASNGLFEWGYWTRDSIDGPLVFLNGKEEPMVFAPGNLWVEAIGIGHKLTLNQP
jgi:hypothetical protein